MKGITTEPAKIFMKESKVIGRSAPVIAGTAVPDGSLRDLDHVSIPENMSFDSSNEYSQ